MACLEGSSLTPPLFPGREAHFPACDLVIFLAANQQGEPFQRKSEVKEKAEFNAFCFPQSSSFDSGAPLWLDTQGAALPISQTAVS